MKLVEKQHFNFKFTTKFEGSEKRTERETDNVLLKAPPQNQNPNVVPAQWLCILNQFVKKRKQLKCELCHFFITIVVTKLVVTNLTFESRCNQTGNIIRHVSSVHEKRKPLKCDFCDYSCVQKVHLTKLSSGEKTHSNVRFVTTIVIKK